MKENTEQPGRSLMSAGAPHENVMLAVGSESLTMNIIQCIQQDGPHRNADYSSE